MFVARAERDRAVSMVIVLPKRIRKMVRGRPRWPRSYPNLRYITTPKIVRMLGV